MKIKSFFLLLIISLILPIGQDATLSALDSPILPDGTPTFLPLTARNRQPRLPGVIYGWDYAGDKWQPYRDVGANFTLISRFDWADEPHEAAPADIIAIYGIPLRYADSQGNRHLYQPSEFPQLPAFVAAHKGSWWQLGNEPYGIPWSLAWPLTVPEYAEWSHIWYYHIKGLDPTAKIALAGMESEPIDGVMQRFDATVAYWRSHWGTFPFNAVDFHCYTYTWDRLRAARDYMRLANINTELWMTEFGCPGRDYATCINFLDGSIAAAKYYSVSKYLWYVGHQPSCDDPIWSPTCLWNEYGSRTLLGVSFSKRVK